MKTIQVKFVLLGLLSGGWLFGPSALAGKITVTGAQPGTTAVVEFVDGSGGSESKQLVVDAGGTATFTFPLSAQRGATRIKKRYIPKREPGQDKDFPPNSTNAFFEAGALLRLEPYRSPNFIPDSTETELTVEIDLVNYLAEGSGISAGQILTVTNGSVVETPNISFGDFTGQVTVAPFDLVEPIPEPSTLALVLIGSAALAIYAQRSRRLPGENRHNVSFEAESTKQGRLLRARM